MLSVDIFIYASQSSSAGIQLNLSLDFIYYIDTNIYLTGIKMQRITNTRNNIYNDNDQKVPLLKNAMQIKNKQTENAKKKMVNICNGRKRKMRVGIY